MRKFGFLTILILLAFPDNVFTQYSLQNAFTNLTFNNPVDLQYAGDGTDRLFIVEQAGIISVIENNSSTTIKKTFLNIVDSVSSGGEMGLLGLAFHPNYENNGYFYVNYTKSSPYRRTLISRFKVSSTNPDSADRASAKILMEISQPYTNHNGGQLAFGPDGYLYIALGDGGSGGDPQNNAQNKSSLLGKLLRIDVDHTQGNLNYAIPSDNPFKGNNQGFREEIYAYGLRNPWRFSFDPPTGRLWCADVGQDNWEEIDLITNGGNYGWRCYEGTHSYNLTGCSGSDYIMPVWEYPHSQGYSITGGYVYRGPNLPELYGKYIYGDYGTRKIWALTYDGVNPATNQLLLTASGSITSFGVDMNNELYVCSFDSKIYRFTPTASIVAPSNLRITSNLPGSITLNWNDNSNNETGFKIERKTGSSNFIFIDSVNANVTAYTDNTVNDTSLYTYRVFAFNSNYSSGYSNSASVLTVIPVELTSFTAELKDKNALIKWSTATERNNKGFYIQRLSGMQQSSTNIWEDIGFVQGKGTSTLPSEYHFIDFGLKNINSESIKYRLRQVDFDGTSHYSGEVEIFPNSIPRKFHLNQNFPNPFNPSTTIQYQLASSGNVSLKVFDLLGNEVATLVHEWRKAGYYSEDFDASLLSSGVYFCQLLVSAVQSNDRRTETFLENKKMILLR